MLPIGKRRMTWLAGSKCHLQLNTIQFCFQLACLAARRVILIGAGVAASALVRPDVIALLPALLLGDCAITSGGVQVVIASIARLGQDHSCEERKE